MKLGIIDIGSNSVRTMKAESDEAGISLRYAPKQTHTTRLAEGLIETGCLSEERMALSLDVIRSFYYECIAEDRRVFAYATSATRDAKNRTDFTSRITALPGLSLSVLSGEEEATLAFLVAGGENVGLIDIGGGSTQISTATFRKSFPMGCVRARDIAPDDSIDTVREKLLPVLDSLFTFPDAVPARWVGIGGTITTLGALTQRLCVYDRGIVNNIVLTSDGLTALLKRLSDMGDDARSKMPLLSKRHNVILQGGTILLYVLGRLGIASLTVSETDGMEGFAVHVLKHLL